MTTALLDAANLYRLKLKAREEVAAQQIELAHAHALTAIGSHLHPLYQDYASRQETIQAADEEAKVPFTFLYEQSRMARVLDVVRAHIGAFATTVHATIAGVLTDAAQLAREAAMAQLAHVRPTQQITSAPSNRSRLLTAMNKVSGLVGGLAQEAVHKVQGALVVGVSIGVAAAVIASHVLQALSVSRWRALTISRTEAFDVYRDESIDTLKLGGVRQWVWTAFAGACAFCVDMDGEVFSMDEDMDSHPNCRCIPLPYPN